MGRQLMLEMKYDEAVALLKKLAPDLPKNPDEKTIKTLRRKLSMKYHPDKNPNSGDMMQKINDALDSIAHPPFISVHGADNRQSQPFEYAQRAYEYQQSRQQQQQQQWSPPPPPPPPPPEDPYARPKKLKMAPWAWAGYGEGVAGDGEKITEFEGVMSYNSFKKGIWELAGSPTEPKKKDEYTFWHFDGQISCGVLTAFANENILIPAAVFLSKLWRGFGIECVIISHGKTKKVKIVIFIRGIAQNETSPYPTLRPFEMQLAKETSNPFSDINFVYKLREEISMRKGKI